MLTPSSLPKSLDGEQPTHLTLGADGNMTKDRTLGLYRQRGEEVGCNGSSRFSWAGHCPPCAFAGNYPRRKEFPAPLAACCCILGAFLVPIDCCIETNPFARP
eukprot:1161009-Pelagomonas_calceolata.AAC.9